MARTGLLAGMIIAAGMSLGAQTAPPGAPPPGTVNVEADPIRCWWRTSASAIRVGEPLSLFLTCAIVENATTTVVPDQSRLDPSAMQLPPFEVIGGQREPDLHSDSRRFFQYQYNLRLISEEMFGRDVRIPSVQINYHLESRVGRGDSIKGRDLNYIMPPASVRVLSIVPADATDIRDAPSWNFGDIEAQRFRARVYVMIAVVLFAVAALVVVMALIRFLRRNRQEGVIGRRLISDSAILGGVGRELSAVRRASEGGGWTPELAGRALAAFRIAGSIALGRAVSQSQARDTVKDYDGQLTTRGGFLYGKKVRVSGAATAEAIAGELATGSGSSRHRQALQQLETALMSFTTALFGREPRLDDTALTVSLGDASGILRQVKLENLWIVKKVRGMRHAAGEMGNRAWSR
jgi:hypothetical protein